MTASAALHRLSPDKLKIWVLAPSLQTSDENIDYYYDFSQSIAEYTQVFAEMKLEWAWQPVKLSNYGEVIRSIAAEKILGVHFPIVVNLCDGDEINGTPGISVVRLLQQSGLVYTGSDEFFYDITTSKVPMKTAFDACNVATAAWEHITAPGDLRTGIFARLGTPLILKPAVSGGSMGLGIRNIVHDEAGLQKILDEMFNGYRGWNLTADGVVAEAFINGREFTTLIVGSHDRPEFAFIYEPVERVFHPSLPDEEKILSFDRLWEIYEDETPMPNDGNFYDYQPAPRELSAALKSISWDAFAATRGTGYTRVDLRMDQQGTIYVLEVNAQCGLSEDENYTSIGAILRFAGKSFTELVKEIINTAFMSFAIRSTKKKSGRILKINYPIPLGKTGGLA